MHFYRCSRKCAERARTFLESLSTTRVSPSSVVICFIIAVRTIAGQLAGGDSVVDYYSDRRGVPLSRSAVRLPRCRCTDLAFERNWRICRPRPFVTCSARLVHHIKIAKPRYSSNVLATPPARNWCLPEMRNRASAQPPANSACARERTSIDHQSGARQQSPSDGCPVERCKRQSPQGLDGFGLFDVLRPDKDSDRSYWILLPRRSGERRR